MAFTNNRFFTCNAVYSKIFKFFDTAEAIRAPLAWPNSKEELGFILMKTFSKLQNEAYIL